MSKAIPTDAMIEAAAKVLNERLAKHDGLFGVSRDMLSAALSAGQAQPVAYTSQPQLDRMAKEPGNNHIMWGEPLPHHADIPLYLHPPAPPAVPGEVHAQLALIKHLAEYTTEKNWADKRLYIMQAVDRALSVPLPEIEGEAGAQNA